MGGHSCIAIASKTRQQGAPFREAFIALLRPTMQPWSDHTDNSCGEKDHRYGL